MQGDNEKARVALVEAVLVGISLNLSHVKGQSTEALQQSFAQLRSRPTFSESARYAVSSAENVQMRLLEAKEAFAQG